MLMLELERNIILCDTNDTVVELNGTLVAALSPIAL